MYRMLQNIVEKRGNDVGFVCDEEMVTYNECREKTIEIANFLIESGVKKGDKVGLIMDTPLDFVYSLMAISYCRAVVVPIYLRQGKDKIKELLTYYEISFVFSKEANELFEDNCDYEVSETVDAKYQLFYNKKYVTDLELKDTALMLFSSGTTSVPKAVMLSYENIMSNIKSIIGYLKIDEKDRILIVKNLNHASSIVGELLVGLYAESCIYMTRKLIKMNTLLRMIQNNRITMFFAIPYILENLLEYKKSDQFDITSLKQVNFYGGKLHGEKIMELCERFPNINFIYSYGLTEASPRVTYISREELQNHYHSCGKEIENVKVEIRDENGAIVSRGIEGEITVEGPNVMKGYYKNPELSKRTVKNGILYTKDIGYKDDEGFLYVTGRKDNMFIIAGKNVHPEEIEGVFNEDESVKESVVTFKEQDNCIEAYVLMNEGYTFDEMKMYQLCKAKLEFYKIPQKIFNVREFDRTVSGKIIRNQEFGTKVII
ncbi:MAG: acyl--CoA ligase [Lachnospiraceae bacterium]|nr:acyl--CoA ligase [Lachnospiraceae bacterium]